MNTHIGKNVSHQVVTLILANPLVYLLITQTGSWQLIDPNNRHRSMVPPMTRDRPGYSTYLSPRLRWLQHHTNLETPMVSSANEKARLSTILIILILKIDEKRVGISSTSRKFVKSNLQPFSLRNRKLQSESSQASKWTSEQPTWTTSEPPQNSHVKRVELLVVLSGITKNHKHKPFNFEKSMERWTCRDTHISNHKLMQLMLHTSWVIGVHGP